MTDISNSSLHIACYGFRGGPGGIPHVMRNFMNTVAGWGHDLDLLLHRPDIPERQQLHPRIRAIELGTGGEMAPAGGLREYLQQQAPQLLLSNREPAHRAFWLAQRMGIPPVAFVPRVGTALSRAWGRRPFYKRLPLVWSMRRSFTAATGVIANSGDVARDVQTWLRVPATKVHVLPNPTVDDSLFEQARQPVAHPWFTDKGPPLFVAVGRLAKQKDYPTLLRALARLQTQRPSRLLILGEGNEAAALQQLARQLGIGQQVDFLGYVANPFAYLARAQGFVLSSAWEGSPNVLIQALALGIPAVATDCPGGSRDILGRGLYGPLPPVGDSSALAEAMATLLDSPPPAARLQEAVQPYQATAACEAYLNAFRQFLSQEAS